MTRMANQTHNSEVAARVRALLTAQGISGRRLARDLNLSAPYVARRLVGEVEFTESDIRAVALRLGVTPAFLIDGESAVAA